MSSNELRHQITATIIDAIENKNLLPWRRPWASGKATGRHRNVQGRAYSGINPLLLEVHAEKHGLTSQTWGTYQQWASLGLQVKKRPDHVKAGAWSATVLLYRPVKKTKIDKDTGEEIDDRFLVARQFSVFNADQVFGPGVEKFQHHPVDPPSGFDADFGPAEELLKATKAVIIHMGEKAYYRRPTPEGSWPNHTEGDWIILPAKEKFVSAGAYYETAFHELAHHSEVRLGWDHRKHGYDYGELVAEMSASYLSAELGVPLGEPCRRAAKPARSRTICCPSCRAARSPPRTTRRENSWERRRQPHTPTVRNGELKCHSIRRRRGVGRKRPSPLNKSEDCTPQAREQSQQGVQHMARHLRLEIGIDYDVDQPDAGYDGWKLISFGRKHSNYEETDKYVRSFDRRSREVTPANIGLGKKLNVGLAFWLSYYEHGQGAWSLIGEGTQCPWDTAYLAGLLLWTGKPSDIGAKTKEARAEDARTFLENFNDWMNGNTFWFRLVNEDGEEIESIGGLVGDEALSEVVVEGLKAGDNVLVEGDGAWMKNYLALPDGVNVVDEFPQRDEAAEPEYVI